MVNIYFGESKTSTATFVSIDVVMARVVLSLRCPLLFLWEITTLTSNCPMSFLKEILGETGKTTVFRIPITSVETLLPVLKSVAFFASCQVKRTH